MKISDAISKKDFNSKSNNELYENFAFDMFKTDEVISVFSYYDRIILLGVMPKTKKLDLPSGKELHAGFFLENREIGIINLGGEGNVIVGKEKYKLGKIEALYIGKGTNNVSFESLEKDNPAMFYCMSAPAHKELPIKLIANKDAIKIELGSKEEINERTIFQLIHPSILETCQVSMGVTMLKPGSAWNTMPAHTHDRRMEAYLYFDIEDDNVVFHFMGEPKNTKHLVLREKQAVINPPWSLHFGVGTKNYNFVWAMAGENKNFTDMDPVAKSELM